MSNGNCTNHCSDIGSYAFAVIQYKDCYCSDLIPREQVPIGGCQVDCPGYGEENCGSKDNGLFIYIQNGQPSGTAPGPSSAQPTSTTVSSTAPPPPPPPPTTTQATSSSTSVTVSTPCLVELHYLYSALSQSCNFSIDTFMYLLSHTLSVYILEFLFFFYF
jgi:cell wall integrity and stress response component